MAACAASIGVSTILAQPLLIARLALIHWRSYLRGHGRAIRETWQAAHSWMTLYPAPPITASAVEYKSEAGQCSTQQSSGHPGGRAGATQQISRPGSSVRRLDTAWPYQANSSGFPEVQTTTRDVPPGRALGCGSRTNHGSVMAAAGRS